MAAENASPTGLSSDKRLILCVDDERIGLEIRKTLLERSGYQVLTAESGLDALVIFDQSQLDAVILDYAMPGMNGGEVAAEMRKRKPEVPLMLLSAYLDLSPDVLAQVNLYVTKGEGPPVLLRKVEELITKNAFQPDRLCS